MYARAGPSTGGTGGQVNNAELGIWKLGIQLEEVAETTIAVRVTPLRGQQGLWPQHLAGFDRRTRRGP